MTKIKICGLTTDEAMDAAQYADFIGFVFYPPSKRAITPEAAGQLIKQSPVTAKKVGLFVNPTDDDLKNTLAHAPLDMIQLHGDETPARAATIRTLTGLPVLKAFNIATADDIAQARAYEDVADWLIFDAKIDGERGGTGHSFDWDLLRHFKSKIPWMLSGGLTIENVMDALSRLTPDAVDISSGVEDGPGKKNPAKITRFIQAVQIADRL